MTSNEPALAGAAVQAELVRSGAVSARELVESTLERIGRLDRTLGSYRAVLADEALAEAAPNSRPGRSPRRSGERLAIHGIRSTALADLAADLVLQWPLGCAGSHSALLHDAVAPSGQSFAASAIREPPKLRIGVAWRSAAFWPVGARLGDAQRAAVDGTGALLRDLGHQVGEREVGFGPATSNAYFFRYLKGIEEDLASLDDDDSISRRTRTMGGFGRAIPDRLIDWSRRVESALADDLAELFDNVDVVLTPGPVQAPTRIGRLDGKGAVRTLYVSGRRIPHFAPWNLVGFPASAVPAGFDKNGLPVAVQLVGPPDGEHTLLSLAGQIERARPWPFANP